MPPRPFLLRLIAPFAVMIMLVVTVCGVVIYWAGQRTVHLQQIRDLDRLAALVRQWLDPSSTTQDVSPQQLEQIRQQAEAFQKQVAQEKKQGASGEGENPLGGAGGALGGGSGAGGGSLSTP